MGRHVDKRFIWAVSAAAWLGWGTSAGGTAPAPAETLPRAVTSYGSFPLGKKPYPAGTRRKWIESGRALARAPAGMLPRKAALRG